MAEYNIKPWNFDKLTTRDLQLIGVAEHAEAYKQQELRNNHDGFEQGGQRSRTNSQEYKEWKQRMAN